jgi:parallel beta-helix repeat protein
MTSRLHPIIAATVAAAALTACGGSSTATPPVDPCAGVTKCTSFAAGTSETAIANAIAQAQAGDTFGFAAGTFKFTNGLDVAAANVTLRGAGREATTLDFQRKSYGVQATGNGFTIRDLGVVDAAGNDVKVEGATGVTVKNVRTWWTGTDKTKNGGYGIYPVACTNVLVEGCYAEGATDTGIYVGQSSNIVIRNNEATGNVAGIEVENCTHADVHDNYVHGNAGGILAFNLPLPVQPTSNQVLIRANRVIDNNTPNFGPPGTTVSEIPAGTGVIVMANHDVEITGNTITGNKTVATTVISYFLSGNAPPQGFNPLPGNVYIHDNVTTGNGTSPDLSNPLGLALAVMSTDASNPVPNVVPNHTWDGVVDPSMTTPNPLNVCIGTSGQSWVNLQTDLAKLAAGAYPFVPDFSATAYRCTGTAVPPVVLP